MSAVSRQRIQVVPTPARPAPATGRRGHVVVAAAVLAIVAAILLALRAGPRGLRGLPAEDRAALVSRTLDELSQYCGPGHAPALDDHCRELSAFAAQFDECRGRCDALVRPFLTPTPTR